MARKQYKNPPLVEVFTEFFFEPEDGAEWDSSRMPTFYKRIAKEFPTRQRLKTAGIEVCRPRGAPPDLDPFRLPAPQHRFISENEKTLVHLGENLLAVCQLPPYYEWEKYQPIILNCFDHYVKVWKPARTARAAIHYIDKVDLPVLEAALDDYFNLVPVLPEFPQQPATNLAMSYEVPGANAGDILVATMKQNASADPDGMTFLFQWDYVATGGLPREIDALKTWLHGAHDFLSGVFRNTFTDECRKLFD